MIDAISQFGILLLLLLTGMETDLKLVRQTGRASIFASLMRHRRAVRLRRRARRIPAGLACCRTRASAWSPSLFLGTALSIASVKIVAMVVREMNFMRRNRRPGDPRLRHHRRHRRLDHRRRSSSASPLHGRSTRWRWRKSVIGTLVFLGVSLTVGRRVVFFVIRWVNDNFVSEFAVDHRHSR